MSPPKKNPELSDLEKADCLTGKMIGGIALKQPSWGSGKRRKFVFDDRTGFYRVMSLVAGGELLFGDIEKEAFRKLLWRMEHFLTCFKTATGSIYLTTNIKRPKI